MKGSVVTTAVQNPMHPASRIPSFVDRAREYLRQPSVPCWLVSLVVHLAVFLILAVVLNRSYRPGGGFGWDGGDGGDPGGGGGGDGVVRFESPRGGGGGQRYPADAGGEATAATTSAAASSHGAGPATLAAALGDDLPSDPTKVLPTGTGSSGSGDPEAINAALAALGAGGGVGGGTGGGVGSGTGGGVGDGTGSGSGGKGRTRLFGVQGEGHKFVYVFDRSASMGGVDRNALAGAKAELLVSLKNLGPAHRFQIIFYNETPTIFNPSGASYDLLPATNENKAEAAKFAASIAAAGGTRHVEALMLAMKLKPDVIFFLTDADEPKLSPGQLAKLHREAAGITINAIEFGFGPQADPDNFLVELARQNGGQHAYVDIAKLFPVSGQ
jgi:hypothetical protein